jgi:hypothetical protein
MSASTCSRVRALPILTVLAALVALLLPSLLAAPASAAPKDPKPGTLRGGSLVQDGWWSRTNEPPPETGVLQPPDIPALGAPKDTLPVTLVNGEPERVAALEFRLKGGADTIVTRVVLTMAESDEAGANVNSDLASVQACPVTEPFWVGAENGPWGTRPDYDCDAGVAPGVRGKKGVWTFDVTSLASAWTSSDRENSPAVVLVGAPPLDPTQGSSSFQVAFDAKKGIGLAAKVTSFPDDGSDGPGTETSPDGEAPVGGTAGSAGDGAGGGTGSGSAGGGAPLGSTDLDPLPAPDSSGVSGGRRDASPPIATEGAPTSNTASPQALVSASAAQPWYAGLGVRSVALVAVALMLAYLVMIAMGGAGQPVVGGRRRGVGRALERLRATRTSIITLEDRT